ncbi:protein phosphatase 2C domain-containing protein [Streptomyces sp. NPDC051920]|uniref:protein phosphatase 2C domain-containing protein n=1 Tax=Streptomyces sp. NPDC051920 TaxID=3155523 RepID=UPI0034348506
MENDMNRAGRMREPEPRRAETGREETPRAEQRRPDAGRLDAGRSDAGRSDVGRLDAGQPGAGQSGGCQHDVPRAEFSWPDAREPDPLDETWQQSVDLFFTDQPESGAPVSVPGTASAAHASGPTPVSYGPDPQPSPSSPSSPSSYEPAPTPPFPMPGLVQQPVPARQPSPAPVPPSPHAPAQLSPHEEPAARTGAVPVLGAPHHAGPKPPLYAPEPRELPSVREDPTAALTPDMVVDGAGYGTLTVRAASVRGDSHRYQGEPRQDSLAVVRLGAPGPDGLLLLAVADGVGSAPRSHVGSQEACRLAAMELDAVSADLAEAVRAGDRPGFAALVDTAVGRIATLLAHRAREHGDDPAAYATTLRALLVPLDPRVRTRGFLAVGDGGTALLRAGEWNLSLTDPEHDGDGMIDTRTAALPHVHRARALLLAPALPGDVLVLCTDGLSTPLAGDAEMREFLASGWGRGAAPAPADFLWQLQYRVKSYDDDRTAVVLWEAVP